ncbi:ankyrin repeat domain-containing protein [Legionella worsleiensis]|uniref:Ankyrin repeat protein n=1 Tax=Legionella worsleiensis TaxID=45076 RepID=A0A0W1AJS4_9GAMM|nr:ankyrin repeat domain-containing protein [Legionella worsleiensis]KTD81561.1 ankyrin repeat protein [Legionella worsleiensis]STY32121.1 ankyrin repeat protein [Legionella worsleiensis]
MTVLHLNTPKHHAAHPLARLIPWTLWRNEFQCHTAHKNLWIFALSPANLLARLNNSSHPYKAILCMLLRYKDVATEALLSFILAIKADHHEDVLDALLVMGRLDVLKRYTNHPDVTIDPQTLRHFWIFGCIIAAKYGSVSSMQYLQSCLSDEEWRKVLQRNDFAVYREAAVNGHLEFLHYLEAYDQLIDTRKVVELQSAQVFKEAFTHGHIDTVKHLYAFMTPEDANAALVADEYSVLLDAAGNGHTAILKLAQLWITQDQFKTMIQINHFQAYRNAAAQGHSDTLMFLSDWMHPEDIRAALSFNSCEVYREAVAQGHVDLLRYLEQWITPEQMCTAIKENCFEGYRKAASYGHLDVLRYLEHFMLPAERYRAVAANQFEGYQQAAAHGYLQILQYLELHMLPHQIKAAVTADYYKAYRMTALNGYLLPMYHIGQHLNSAQRHAAFQANKFQMFRVAAKGGYINLLELLKKVIEDSVWKEAIAAEDYKIYTKVAECGQTDVLQLMERSLSAEQLSEALSNYDSDANYLPCNYAAENAHLETVKYLESKMTEQQLCEMFDDSKNPFEAAVYYGHIDLIKHFESYLLPWTVIDVISANGWRKFEHAVFNNNLAVVKFIATYMSQDEIVTCITKEDYFVYRQAFAKGCLLSLAFLEQYLQKDEIRTALKYNNYSLYGQAMQYGGLAAQHYFERFMAYDEVREAVKSSNFQSLRYALSGDDLSLVAHLQGYVLPDELREVFANNQFGLWRNAVLSNKIETVRYLQDFMSLEQMQQSLAHNNFGSFIQMVAKGHIETLNYLFAIMPLSFMQSAVQAQNYAAYAKAFLCRNDEVVYLIERHMTATQIQAAVLADNCLAYFQAMQAPENLHHAERQLKHIAPNQIPERILANIYLSAIENGQISTLRYLERFMGYDLLNMVVDCLCGFEDFATIFGIAPCYEFDLFATAKKYPEVIWHLLQHLIFLEWMLFDQRNECSDVLYPFIFERCEGWRKTSEFFAVHYPSEVFTLSEGNTLLALRLAIALITINTEVSHEYFRFLLGIPSVLAQAHADVHDEQNALLRAAYRHGNQMAAELLMTVPMVFTIARAANFYENDLAGHVDLRAIAQDSESSMRSLSAIELGRLSRLKEHYFPDEEKKQNQNKALRMVRKLRGSLIKKYQKNPAVITVENKDCILPLTWDEFQSLNLAEDVYKTALKHYYLHPVHTALRWLLKPNPWLSVDAFFSEGDRFCGLGYSSFERFIPEIALFWMAAKDKDKAATPTDGHTYKGRIGHFIAELALLNRAHNWDEYRPDGGAKQEQYDDGEGDKPSCPLGTLSRLFNSLIGHPFLSPLGTALLDQELRDFARAHFIKRITSENMQQLVDALSAIDEPSEAQQAVLRSLDISSEAFAAFIARLSVKYLAEWLTCHTEHLKNRMEFKPGATFHVTRLWNLVDFPELLELCRNKFSTGSSSFTFFAASSGASSSLSLPQSACDDSAKRLRDEEDIAEEPAKRSRNS